jgi:hypothetical protein
MVVSNDGRFGSMVTPSFFISLKWNFVTGALIS